MIFLFQKISFSSQKSKFFLSYSSLKLLVQFHFLKHLLPISYNSPPPKKYEKRKVMFDIVSLTALISFLQNIFMCKQGRLGMWIRSIIQHTSVCWVHYMSCRELDWWSYSAFEWLLQFCENWESGCWVFFGVWVRRYLPMKLFQID